MKKMRNNNERGWLGIAITLITLSISLLALLQSCEANKISKGISSITNRPYILINGITAEEGSSGSTDQEVFLPIEYTFTLFNDGTLPAWINGYEIYVNGPDVAQKMLFGPSVKPTKNFTIGKEEPLLIGWRSVIKQKINEKNGPVDAFKSSKHKMLLIVVSYKTMGDVNGKNIFTTWQLVKFGKFQNIESGTNSLTLKDIRDLFKDQEKIFELDEAK